MRHRTAQKNENQQTIMSSIEDFLSSSSIHGLAQIARSPNEVVNRLWLLVVSIGFILTFLMTFMCCQDWTEEPISTSVVQIPIEHIIFPAVTICPLGVAAIDTNVDNDISVLSLLQSCRFNKNGQDMSGVCNRIQEIFNENGICLTVNNIDISINSSLSPVKVPGVGIDNSLQITLNSTTTGKKVRYRIFISEVGTTVSKVFFDIDPLYRGHQTFHIHGIHYVQASDKFKAWNEDHQVCYFPHQKKLKYFNSYLQDNCKRECSWNKSICICGCAPKSLYLKDVQQCDEKGLSCWNKVSIKDSSEQTDEESCDCKNNCEMTHFFFSLIREPLEDEKLMPLVFYFDTHIITQVNLNVKHTFFDKISAIGGTLGLFCGVSMISILELLYYFVIFLRRLVSQKAEKEDKISLNTNNRFN